MDGVRIEIDAAAVSHGLQRLHELLDRPRAAFDEIGASLVVSTQRRFELERGPDGEAWTPSKRALRTGGKTLRLSNRLWKSITHRAEDDQVHVGTDVAYAAIHQFGGEIKRAAGAVTTYRSYNARRDELSARFVKAAKANFSQQHQHGAFTIDMPARPFLGIDEGDRQQIGEIFRAHLARALRGGRR